MKITADLKCLACGRIWGTVQDDSKAPLMDSRMRSLNPECLPRLSERTKRCPRCGGTLLLEITEAEEYETDLLIGA